MCPKILFVLSICTIFLLELISCLQNETHNSDERVIEPRIVGGYRTYRQSLAKYIVSIRSQYEVRSNFGYTHLCAGTIIGKNKILTAAHCVYSLPVQIKVVAKTIKRLSRSRYTEEIKVKKIFVHPDYDDYNAANDIALLMLERNILIDGRSAVIISLPKEDITPGEQCEVAGWGTLYVNGPMANEILHTDLHIHTMEECKTQFAYFSNTQICASNRYDDEKDACLGDSGGPLICNNVVTGIVSYGYGCASGIAGIYTNVFKYVDWINSNGQKFLKPNLFPITLNLILSAVVK